MAIALIASSSAMAQDVAKVKQEAKQEVKDAKQEVKTHAKDAKENATLHVEKAKQDAKALNSEVKKDVKDAKKKGKPALETKAPKAVKKEVKRNFDDFPTPPPAPTSGED